MKNEKTTTVAKEKKKSVSLWICYAVLMAIAITITMIQSFMKEQYYGAFANPVSNIEVINYMYQEFIPHFLRTIQIIALAVTGGVILHFLMKIVFPSKKVMTVTKLLLSFLKWVVAIAAVFVILGEWGANTTFMWASAGIATLIIGLGSQALVADILAGIFIVFEGDFQVGDIVVIDGWRGEVLAIGVRTTKLIDAGGNIKIVNNSDIRSIINQTQELSIAKCYVGIGYEARIENVEAVIADNIESLKEKIPDIVEGPYYKGVSELADSSVNLLFVAKCHENDIYQVQRDLNREIKIMFDNNNVNIPFNQVVVHMGEDDKPKEIVSKRTEKKVQEFTEEQKELSKDIEIKK